MRLRNHFVAFVTIALATVGVFVVPVSAGQDDVRVSATVPSGRVYVGQPVRLQVIVAGSLTPEEPTIGPINGAEIRARGGSERRSSSVTVINGRREVREFIGYVFSYDVLFSTPGVKTIPSIEVVVDGRTYATQPAVVQVAAPETDDDVHLRIGVDRTSPFVGQPIELTVTLYIRTTVQNLSFVFGDLDRDFEIHDVEAAPVPGRRVQSLELLGSDVPMEQGRGMLDGNWFDTVMLRKVLIPRRAGALTIGPGVLSCEVVMRRARSFFDDNVTRRVAASSNAIELNVKALPEVGRPREFSGHIGRFSIESHARPTTVNVGDPIEFVVVMRSDGPVVSPPEIDLARLGGFADNFRIGTDSKSAKRQRDASVYEFTLRPLRADVSEIPPVELSYFDPESGAYATARTGSIALTIKPTRIVTAEDSIGNGQSTGGGMTIEDVTGGIAHNADRAAALRDDRFDLRVVLSSPGVVAGLAAGPIVYLAALGVFAYRKRQEQSNAGARKRRALSDAKKRLTAIGRGAADVAGAEGRSVLGTVRGAVLGYFEARLDRPAGTMTTEEAATCVEGFDVALAERMRVLLARCDAGRFGGAEGEGDEGLVNEARELLDAIDGEMRS